MKHYLRDTFCMTLFCLLTGIMGTHTFVLKAMTVNGDSTTMLKLGVSYLRGTNNVQKNPEKGFALIMQCAKDSDADAQYVIAECYRTGVGVKRDTIEYINWLKNSAANENLDAINDLSRIYRMLPESKYAVFSEIRNASKMENRNA